jgi:predicted AAA+ superfamily ATPase
MRYLSHLIARDLDRKMVFLGGPRQCGKTTLAQGLLKSRSGIYLNWDSAKHRKIILSEGWSDDERLIVLDELHKHGKWKNWIKGVYDTQKQDHQFLVTGSARLDVYRRGGDSLFGRYHHWRLHPFTLAEIPKGITPTDAFNRLMRVGGFPEPFLDGGETHASRWRNERTKLAFKEDVRTLENIRDLSTMELFVDALKARLGSPIVLNNIAQDLQVSPKTLAHWLEILERMYLVFVVRPYTHKLPRAIQKPPKVFFFDNAEVDGDEGARFENLVATHLLRNIQFMEDRSGDRFELCYLRDKEGREVDFVVVKNKRPIELIEAKWRDDSISKSLAYYAERLKPDRALQIVAETKRAFVKNGISLVTAVNHFGAPEG